MDSLIYKEPLKVVCVKTGGSIKLVKGAIYLATRLISNKRNNSKNVYLKNLGFYNAENFTYNDKKLTEEKDFIIEYNGFDSTKNYTGKFVVCNWSNSKFIKEGETYYVESHIKDESGIYYNKSYYNHKFKIKGIKTPINAYQFSEVPLVEQRNLKLKNLNGENVISNIKTRKFLLYTEKEKTLILFEALSKILKDLKDVNTDNKIPLSNLILIKTKKYDVKLEDLNDFIIKSKPLLESYSNILF